MRMDQMGAKLEFVNFTPDGIDLAAWSSDCIVLHHPGGSSGFSDQGRSKTLIYATDAEYKDLSPEALKPYLEFFREADAIIFDAMYTFSEAVTKEGWGHSTSLVGVDLSVKTGIKKLILFHHEPTYSDEKLRRSLKKPAPTINWSGSRGTWKSSWPWKVWKSRSNPR